MFIRQPRSPANSVPAPVEVNVGQSSGVRLTQEVPLTVRAAATGPTQQYTVNVNVVQEGGRKAAGTLTVNVEGK